MLDHVFMDAIGALRDAFTAALLDRLATGREEHMALERRLATSRLLADLGKQLFAAGHRPAEGGPGASEPGAV